MSGKEIFLQNIDETNMTNILIDTADILTDTSNILKNIIWYGAIFSNTNRCTPIYYIGIGCFFLKKLCPLRQLINLSSKNYNSIHSICPMNLSPSNFFKHLFFNFSLGWGISALVIPLWSEGSPQMRETQQSQMCPLFFFLKKKILFQRKR